VVLDIKKSFTIKRGDNLKAIAYLNAKPTVLIWKDWISEIWKMNSHYLAAKRTITGKQLHYGAIENTCNLLQS
jgi:hypothetical protein